MIEESLGAVYTDTHTHNILYKRVFLRCKKINDIYINILLKNRKRMDLEKKKGKKFPTLIFISLSFLCCLDKVKELKVFKIENKYG